MITAIQSIIERAGMDQQQIAILRLVGEDKTNTEIAETVGCSVDAVSRKLGFIRACLSAATGQQYWSRRSLAVLACNEGLLSGGGNQ